MKPSLTNLSQGGLRLAIAIASASLLSCCYDPTPSPRIAQGLDWDHMCKMAEHSPDDCTQERLATEEKADIALIFIGGFFDSTQGQLRRCYDALPSLGQDQDKSYKELRAYYHWEGNEGNLLSHSTKTICKDLTAWLSLNPNSTLVIIGHSYGGSAAMDVARQLPASFKGRLIVATLDPVSRRERSEPKQRAPRVDYWINCYISNRRALHEAFIQLGGTWDYCKDANVSLSQSGKEADFTGKARHSHRRALSMLIECAAGSNKSVWTYLQDAINQ